MTVIPAFTGFTVWGPKTGPTGSFRPNGPMRFIKLDGGPSPNPIGWNALGPSTVSARLFVGFNVGKKPTWSIDDLVTLVRQTRQRQKRRPDASFVAQKGIYSHTKKGKRPVVVEEDGAQVLIINLPGESAAKFRANMVALAERIVKEFQQAEVVLELQRGGLVEETMGITA
jgi:hypothetical protein